MRVDGAWHRRGNDVALRDQPLAIACGDVSGLWRDNSLRSEEIYEVEVGGDSVAVMSGQRPLAGRIPSRYGVTVMRSAFTRLGEPILDL